MDTEASLLNLTECFDLLYAEATLGCRLLDSFPGHISFHSCNHSSLRDCKTHLQSLDCLCLEASFFPSTFVVVTDISVIPSRRMQAVFAVHLWNLGQQVLSSKAPAGRTTVLDAKLFAIRLDIAKATSMAIEYIILITDSLGSVRQAVDLSVYPRQAHSLAVCSTLKLFFSQDYGYRIDFWDCSSKAEWFFHQLVHNNMTNTRVAAGLYLATSINFLCSKNVISCLDTWRTSLNHSTVQGQHFLPLRDRNQ